MQEQLNNLMANYSGRHKHWLFQNMVGHPFAVELVEEENVVKSSDHCPLKRSFQRQLADFFNLQIVLYFYL